MNYFSSGIILAEVDKLLSSFVGPSSAYVYYALSNIPIDPYLVHVDYLPSASNNIPSNLFTRTLPGNLLSSASIHTWQYSYKYFYNIITLLIKTDESHISSHPNHNWK